MSLKNKIKCFFGIHKYEIIHKFKKNLCIPPGIYYFKKCKHCLDKKAYFFDGINKEKIDPEFFLDYFHEHLDNVIPFKPRKDK